MAMSQHRDCIAAFNPSLAERPSYPLHTGEYKLVEIARYPERVLQEPTYIAKRKPILK
jgi:hypothetical protein